MRRIFIDPGHGGRDPGASGEGLLEKHLTLDLALGVAARLPARGLEVRLSRTADQTVSLASRVHAANRWPADVFVSIHINAGGGTGFASYIHHRAGATAAEVRDVLHRQVAAFLTAEGFPDRGARTADFHVLRRTTMAAVLLGCLFIDGRADAGWLGDPSNRERLAQQVASGVARAAGLRVETPSGRTQPADAGIPDPWAEEAWAWATERGLLDGTRPRNAVTRQELAVILQRLHGGQG